MKVSLLPYFVLILMGAAWGLGIALTKITVATGYGPFVLIFWQFVLGTIILGFISIMRRKLPFFGRKTIFNKKMIFFKLMLTLFSEICFL